MICTYQFGQRTGDKHVFSSGMIAGSLCIVFCFLFTPGDTKIDDYTCNIRDFSSTFCPEDGQQWQRETYHPIFRQVANKDLSKLFNFASTDCEAEIKSTNWEAENAEGILNDRDQDEYLRTPCDSNKFIIVQLCETIHPALVELANFELFSSSIKTFKVLASTKNPANNWAFLGEFTAENNRLVQRFRIPAHKHHAKFVKIEWISHYGDEYYCTLSTLKVYGAQPEADIRGANNRR